MGEEEEEDRHAREEVLLLCPFVKLFLLERCAPSAILCVREDKGDGISAQ